MARGDVAKCGNQNFSPYRREPFIQVEQSLVARGPDRF